MDAIVHLAGISNDPIGSRFEEVTLDINYRASIELARKAKGMGVTVLHIRLQLQHVWLGG